MPKTATPDGPGERVALLSRTTIELRKQLEHAASLSGRSLGQEVERRLERTFDFDYLLGDNETALVLRSIANAIRRFELASGKSWVKDSETQARVHEAVSKMVDVLLAVRPEVDDRRQQTGEGLPVDWSDPEMRAGFRTMALDAAIHDLKVYRDDKEQESKRLRPAGAAQRGARRQASQAPADLPHETRVAEAAAAAQAGIAAALQNATPGAELHIGGVNGGPLVQERGPNGELREVVPTPRKPKRTPKSASDE
ncbi:hypothetical protein [Lichenibacterium dinghuense]|uniref:hypothetical protein n=1 Tax=Lichenibacterium dinghuense TaxID=2895977 RepID=UPI001F2003E3|nr:hypothetical protein [Lichenibacterium sp. 6Y81]